MLLYFNLKSFPGNPQGTGISYSCQIVLCVVSCIMLTTNLFAKERCSPLIKSFYYLLFNCQIFQLPACTPDSICGYLQANVRGINHQRLCACQTGSHCAMTWDSEDGHSVTQGSDQYKVSEYYHKLMVSFKAIL